MKDVLFITGPTATGKTEVALAIARELGGEIISADSMQIYRELHIGTARPLECELDGVPHHLMGFLSPDEQYNVAKYQADAIAIIERLHKQGRIPIVVGGTGLYINALLYDIDFSEMPDLALREQLGREYDTHGAEALHDRLKALDEASAGRIHPNDKKRLVRRLEILLQQEEGSGTGTTGYDFRKPQNRFHAKIAILTKERAKLYEDINTRVDRMMAAGLEAEVRRVYDTYGADITAFTAIGYKEFLPYLSGACTLEEVVAHIKRNTRRFAKRQLTWFKREEGAKWFMAEAYERPDALADDIVRAFML